MGLQKTKRATAFTPQVVTLIIDDSGSMSGNKANQVTAAVQDMVITMQSANQGSSWSRFILNICKFGSNVTPIVMAAKPEEIDLSVLRFDGSSGLTEMHWALEWGRSALENSLNRCRNEAPNYDEVNTPSPLCVFFSDGANTGPDVRPAAQSLKTVYFKGGQIDVVACGIGMDSGSLIVMEQISSQPDLSVNIDPDTIADFIAAVGATAMKSENPRKLVERSKRM
ncbi:MAG: vWA domain-containing protein [Candidatus Omnitrophota bacterium]